ncbi:hypothetical protein [Streptomyces sp. NPDC005805]|uniref:hypothetical protein n=1 Tax=Streptomyces sp. NPDC005805 TaxID=3157068 RepID=UPI0033F3D529
MFDNWSMSGTPQAVTDHAEDVTALPWTQSAAAAGAAVSALVPEAMAVMVHAVTVHRRSREVNRIVDPFFSSIGPALLWGGTEEGGAFCLIDRLEPRRSATEWIEPQLLSVRARSPIRE